EPACHQKGNIKNRARDRVLLNRNQNRFHDPTSVAFQASLSAPSIPEKMTSCPDYPSAVLASCATMRGAIRPSRGDDESLAVQF
ncbi:hypothetical protein AAII07_59605, partial [Microvirga sp. 0TCS3.31]